MSEDHNELNQVLSGEEEYTFLKNELSELSRRLYAHWGMMNEDRLDTLLHEQHDVILEEGDCIMLVTDGLYLPILRSRMDLTHYRVTRSEYYLENWLERFINDGGYFDAEDARLRWHDMIADLIEYCTTYTARKTRYRDDIAVVGLRMIS